MTVSVSLCGSDLSFCVCVWLCVVCVDCAILYVWADTLCVGDALSTLYVRVLQESLCVMCRRRIAYVVGARDTGTLASLSGLCTLTFFPTNTSLSKIQTKGRRRCTLSFRPAQNPD